MALQTPDAKSAHACPTCHSPRVRPTVQTDYGEYYRCDACGDVWHEDHLQGSPTLESIERQPIK